LRLEIWIFGSKVYKGLYGGQYSACERYDFRGGWQRRQDRDEIWRRGVE
jgi:hypothetical protein